MTGRSVPEWQGATPDTKAPPRVRLRVWEREGGCCHRCRRKIAAGEGWTLEHVTALINGGANAESNLALTCDWCLPGKNAEDVAEKAVNARRRAKHIGAKPPPRNPIPGSKASGWKRTISGQTVRRNP